MPRETLILEPLYRRGTSAEWAAANPVLADREIGVDTTANRRKRGNGTTPWLSLPFLVTLTHYEAGPPTADAGAVGDFWADTAGKVLYGPKGLDAWPASPVTSLAGPAGQSVTSVSVTGLAAGSAPTRTYNASTGALALGIPAGAAGTPGTPGTNGQSVTAVTVSTLAAGSNATATYNAGTGALALGVPTGAAGTNATTTAAATTTVGGLMPASAVADLAALKAAGWQVAKLTTDASGLATWTFAVPFAAGVVPVVMANAVASVAGSLYNVQLNAAPTNTAAVVKVNVVSGTAVNLLGLLSLTLFTPAPSGVVVHVAARAP